MLQKRKIQIITFKKRKKARFRAADIWKRSQKNWEFGKQTGTAVSAHGVTLPSGGKYRYSIILKRPTAETFNIYIYNR